MPQAAVFLLISMSEVDWQSFSGEGELNQHQTAMLFNTQKNCDQVHCVLNNRRRGLLL
jgi:hypothetical protein